MTRPSCVRCHNANHEACDGGAWDERYKPVVCECFLLYHGGEPIEPEPEPEQTEVARHV